MSKHTLSHVKTFHNTISNMVQ